MIVAVVHVGDVRMIVTLRVVMVNVVVAGDATRMIVAVMRICVVMAWF